MIPEIYIIIYNLQEKNEEKTGLLHEKVEASETTYLGEPPVNKEAIEETIRNNKTIQKSNGTESTRNFDTEDLSESTDSSKGTSFFLQPTLWKVILWFLLWGLFIELEFGAVYFCLSLLFVVYTSMKPKSRKEGELSAYSVFNPNCERIDGTLTAEQFETELRFGAAAVH
eukprot:GHVT01091467.1.p1 GENE.GHVT01091467.1~~GHVT01091467.1.p1  ORF type:complete len:170 (-),score=12.58 GHVT01091467.1:230-739(-)